MTDDIYRADPSLRGKLRRRLVRLYHRHPAMTAPPGPMISFSFDDAPRSAATTGASILETYNARGTFLVCGALTGTTFTTGLLASDAELVDLHRRGHEIGCHTLDHIDCGQMDELTIRRSLDANAGVLTGLGLPSPTAFAYPYGDVSSGAKRAVATRFRLARGLHPGLVGKGTDLHQAPALGLEGEQSLAQARHWMARALRETAWLILFTHNVHDDPGEFDISSAGFEGLVRDAKGQGFQFVTLSEGARLVGGGS